MELKIVYTLTVILVFSKIAILSGVKIDKGIKTGTFKVVHQHPGINKCAATVLQKNDLVGGRVSNVTGVCEGLSYLWSVNETMESGYAYVKKISVQENYHPPFQQMTNLRTVGTWMVPGTLSTGAKVEVTFGGTMLGFSIYLVDSSMEFEDYSNPAEEVRRSRHYITLT